MARGRLRVYLGAAPGVGKTYAMLAEGQRDKAAGADVVIGLVEPHGRRLTADMVEGLELVPRRTLAYRGRLFTEMDLDAVLDRRPQVALVDELAHTNVPGTRNEKRWQDVERILDAGIDVVTTLNIQHLESLKDVVEQITGVRQSETIPDEVVRRADQIELVDLTPEALRRRMVQGYIYPADRIDVALTHYFRPGNLTALRELGLLWLADRVEEGLRRYRIEHGIVTPWETKERIVVALSGHGEEALIRRAARIADRIPGSELLAVHVIRTDDETGADPAVLAGQRALVESLGGSYHQVVGADVAAAITQFAHAENATQLILGGAGHGRLTGFLLGDRVVHRTIRRAGHIDVHILTRERRAAAPAVTLPPLMGGLGRARFWWGGAVAALLLPGLTLALLALPGVGLAGVLLLYLLGVVAVASVGGLYPALAAAVGAGVLVDYYFVPPARSLTVGRSADAAVLAVFVAVASLVSGAVERTERRARAAARSSAEAATLSDLATGALRGGNDLPALLERVRETFGLGSVSLLERDDTGGRRWFVVASAGRLPPERPEDADVEVSITDSLVLAGHGRSLDADDRRVFTACAALVAASLEDRRSEERAAERVSADRRRADLLRAVAGDMEPELAAARRALEGLRDGAAPRTGDERGALRDLAEGAVERLGGLVAALAELSRLDGALDVFLRPVDVGDVLVVAVDDLGPGGRDLLLRLPQDLPNVIADAALLTRLVTYLAAHALRRSPADAPPHIEAAPVDGRVEIRLVDHGVPVPGYRGRDGESRPAGIVPRVCADIAQAIGGVLRWEQTDGGGFTAVLGLPAATARGPAATVAPAPAEADANRR